LPDVLTNAADQVLLAEFLESVDVNTVPFVTLAVRRQGDQVFVSFDSIIGVNYTLEAKAALDSSSRSIAATATGTGERLELAVNINTAAKFLLLVAEVP